MIKLICQFCDRPTKEDDLVKWMCSLCRAFRGHIPDPAEQTMVLKQLRTVLTRDIALLTDGIKRLSQKTAVGWSLCVKEDRQTLAKKQRKLSRVKQLLGQQIELTGQDIRNDRISKKLSQAEYAKLLDVTPRHLRRVEKCINGINKKMLTRLKNVRF